MKIIFDFDDTLFSTEDFKEVLFSGLVKFGVSKEKLNAYYLENRKKFTNPKNFYLSFILDNKLNISMSDIEESLSELFNDLKRFLNQELIDIVKKLGPENCFIVSTGEEDFQKKKMKSCEIDELFGEIHVVAGDKNEAIEKLMDRFEGEDFVFIDDSFDNLEKAKEIINKVQVLHAVHYPTEIDRFRKLIS